MSGVDLEPHAEFPLDRGKSRAAWGLGEPALKSSSFARAISLEPVVLEAYLSRTEYPSCRLIRSGPSRAVSSLQGVSLRGDA